MIFAYVRASTGKQVRTLDAQREVILRYATMRAIPESGLTFIEDAAVSGGMPFIDRPGGKEIMRAVADGKVEALILATLDRAFRMASDALNVTDALLKKGCSLCVADFNGMPIDAGTPIGKMLLTMLSGFAEFEKARIAERTSAVLRDAVTKQEIVYSPKCIPLGYRPASKRRIEKNPMEQEALWIIQDKKDTMSFEGISRLLKSKGLVRYDGRPITGRMIRHYLGKGKANESINTCEYQRGAFFATMGHVYRKVQ